MNAAQEKGTLLWAIETADQILFDACTYVCGQRFNTRLDITKKQARMIALCCEGDQTSDLAHGYRGEGWSMTRQNPQAPLVLNFARAPEAG
jgi:hypothetical protein